MSSLSPAAILYDASGNPVGIVLDGSVYRLQVAATVDAPLPAGTNEIGKVAQGSPASGDEAWPAVLYSVTGGAVTVYPRGDINFLATRDQAVLHELRVIVEHLEQIEMMIREVVEEDTDT